MSTPLGSVLLVEDDANTRSVMKAVISLAGFEVEAAANGREALERLRADPRPGVILLDLTMPRMDGWDFCRETRRHPALADIPVVLVSAVDDLHEQAQGLGADTYLRKPVAFEELLGLLRRYERAAATAGD